MKEKNCFVTLFDLLKVKYTRDFSNQYINEPPHKNNLYGLSLFSQLISAIIFRLSKKVIIFVRLFPYWKVFVLVYMQFDNRKPTAGYNKLHRLLYFIRAVGLPTPTGSCRIVGVGEKSCTGYTTAGLPE